MIEYGAFAGVFVIGILVGRAMQRWIESDIWRWEEEIFHAGRREGYEEGHWHGRLGIYQPPVLPQNHKEIT